jgi:signal transduction histidine kinase
MKSISHELLATTNNSKTHPSPEKRGSQQPSTIGLSVSRSIIENHRGRLRADPNGGPGATFSFCIPRIPELQRGAQSLHAAIPINNATLEG